MVLIGAVGVITQNQPVHAALSLILTLFGVAVLFISLEANFLAAVQVIVYAGAIVVLFLFVIMLLGIDKAEKLYLEAIVVKRYLAGVISAGIFVLIAIAAIVSRNTPTRVITPSAGVGAVVPEDHDSNIRRLARDLFSDHVLAFELTSVLLVIAVVATVMLARRAPKSTTETPT